MKETNNKQLDQYTIRKLYREFLSDKRSLAVLVTNGIVEYKGFDDLDRVAKLIQLRPDLIVKDEIAFDLQIPEKNSVAECHLWSLFWDTKDSVTLEELEQLTANAYFPVFDKIFKAIDFDDPVARARRVYFLFILNNCTGDGNDLINTYVLKPNILGYPFDEDHLPMCIFYRAPKYD